MDQPTPHQLPVDQYHQVAPLVYHETDNQVMDTLPVRGYPLPQPSVSTPVQHQETHKKPVPVTIHKLIYTPKRHLPAANQNMHEPREGRTEGREKGLQRLSSVPVSESGSKTSSRFTFQIPQLNKPTTSSSNQTTATTASRTIPSTLPPKQSVRRPNPLTITTPTQPAQLHISTPIRPQQRNIIASSNTIQSPRTLNVLPPQAEISTQHPQQLPDQSTQDSNDGAVMENEKQAYHPSIQQQQELDEVCVTAQTHS